MRDRKQRKYGQDQPWREERRQRYPDEPYGGEREWRSGADDRQSNRGRGWEPNQDWRGQGTRGADYRGDVGPEGYGERGRMDWNESRWNRGASFGFGPEEDSERSGNYAYGSPYGQGDMGSERMGRGDWNEPRPGNDPRNWTNARDWSNRGDRAGGAWQDTDWAPNRPARGRGGWAGDWAMPTGADTAMSGNADTYAGRGPKDYRRGDDRIREEICDIFTDDARLDPSEVFVKVEGSEVTLTGTVSSRDQKRRAEELAERVRGVGDVHNQLRVMRGETTTGTTSTPPTATRGGRAGSSQQQGVAHDRDRDR
jgi:hypothetical protein